jgi:Protein of unknown function (DUF3175)
MAKARNMKARRPAHARKSAATAKPRSAGKRWSADVTKHSHALELEEGVFTWDDPQRIARSLKRSAEASTGRKADPYRSALSMLTFYINRAGKNLPEVRKKVLTRAKAELRTVFGRG